jgi:predicted nucleotidyltransferase component of viral defense system
MNNLQANFSQVIEFARMQAEPTTKVRGILREYLHTKFLVHLYRQPRASKISLVGGTGLRLLHNLDRFSEDLDFDNLGLMDSEIADLIQETVVLFKNENYDIELVQKSGELKSYFEIRFPNLLFELAVSTNPKEKIKIKIDYSNLWRGQAPRSLWLNKYGMIENIVSNPLDQVLVQKLAAYIQRIETQARDIYDVVWLFSRGARLDKKFMKENSLETLLEVAKQKFTEQGILPKFSNRLRPFLFDEQKVSWLNQFGEVLGKLGEGG